VNPNPQRFDIERADIQHQSFGGGSTPASARRSRASKRRKELPRC
jgi:hypothetical protein